MFINNNATEKLEMHGINFNYGLHYTAALKNNYFFNAGISCQQPEKIITTDYQQLAYKYTAYNTRDTISYIADDSTKTYIPGTLGLGFTFGKINKFTAGFDFIYTKWSGCKYSREAEVILLIQDHIVSGLNIFLTNIQITVF